MTEAVRQRVARVHAVPRLPETLDELGVPRDRPVLVLVGGAGGMSDEDLSLAAAALRQWVLPAVIRLGVAVVDGGTDSGIMRVTGAARAESGADFPLVGVAASGTVSSPGDGGPGAAGLEPRHSHVILVPGDDWGDESAWLAFVADAIAGPEPSATLVVNGGEITYDDIARSEERGRPVVVLAGTGRTADAIGTADAAAITGQGDPRPRQVARSPLTRVVDVHDGPSLARTIESLLDRPAR